jgi:hypothetical protein
VTELPYLDAGSASALLKELTPFAQALLDGLFDTGELDWSAGSARAGRSIGRLCSRHRDPGTASQDLDADLVDYATVVGRFPEVYRPGLLRLPPDKLARECEAITRFLGSNEHWHPEIKKDFGVPSRDGTYVHLDVLGVRAWYRTAAGMTPGGDVRRRRPRLGRR